MESLLLYMAIRPEGPPRSHALSRMVLISSSLQTLQALSTSASRVQAPANGTQSDFQLNQIALATTQQKAIGVRERNQRLADELSSPSAMGLAMVAQTQVAVMLDVQSLKGEKEDEQMLGKLVDRVKEAMSQNAENLKMVELGCGK